MGQLGLGGGVVKLKGRASYVALHAQGHVNGLHVLEIVGSIEEADASQPRG